MATNYDLLFGNPKKASETIETITTCCSLGDSMCGNCPIHQSCLDQNLEEFLLEDADGN